MAVITPSLPGTGINTQVNFDGTGIPVIRSSKNILGIVDNGLGDWSPIFIKAQSNVNYLAIGLCGNLGFFTARILTLQEQNLGSVRINTTSAFLLVDVSIINLIIVD